MEHVQNLSAGPSTTWPAMSELATPDKSVKTIKADPEGDDHAGKADSAVQAVPRRAGTPGSDKLARIFMRSKNMELESGIRSMISDCKTDWLSRTLIAHNAAVPALAETLLTAAQGDMTEAFVFAAAMGDSCTASAFFEAGADTVEAAKGLIDRGEWDAVQLIIKDRLFRFSEGSEGLSGVVTYALESNNAPSGNWLKWLCGDVPSAEKLVAAHFGQKRHLVRLMDMARSQSISPGPLMEAVINMPDLSREERISAIRTIVDSEEVPEHGAFASDKALHEQLVQSNIEAAELMIAGGVGWNHALFLAGSVGDGLAIKNLLRCNGVRQNDVMNVLLSRPSPDGKSAIVYSMIQHYVLEGHSSSSSKIRELKGLLNARPEIKGLFRDLAEIMLRNEIEAGNTHAVAILMTAGVTLDDINDLDWLADPMRTRVAQQQVDAHSNPGNTVKPSKQFV
ncbi:hypothetical protein [Bordetella muralis]|uniref:hypothetical protein n=1 Tax=Bordetella muralis TaxID=1649130 RepID=UPI0039F0F6E7